jgi:hypothetical protein
VKVFGILIKRMKYVDEESESGNERNKLQWFIVCRRKLV